MQGLPILAGGGLQGMRMFNDNKGKDGNNQMPPWEMAE